MVDIIPKLTDEEYADIGKFVMDNCAYGVNVNMNDTFFWGCADSETAGLYDLIDVVKMYKKYGKAGLDAYVAVKRQEKDPNFSHGSCIRGYYNQQYWSDFALASEEWLNYETFEGCLVEYGTRFAD